MTDVRPFRGLRYSPAVIPELGAVICEPFDVIGPKEQEALYARSPHNVVRVELPRPAAGGDPYASAAGTLKGWVDSGVVVREESPAYYVTRHTFEYLGRRMSRIGLTGAVRVEPFDSGSVKPHENTRKGPKGDRLRLMEATKANVSPILLMYEDDRGIRPIVSAVKGQQPAAVARLGGETYVTWVVTDPAAVEAVQAALAAQPLYIADGHHRYETAIAYRDRVRERDPNASDDEAHAFMLGTLVAFDDPGLLSLPYHRLLLGLDDETLARLRDLVAETYAVEHHEAPASAQAAANEALDNLGSDGVAFDVFGLEPGRRTTLRLKSEETVKAIAGSTASLAWASLGASLFRETLLRPLLGVEEEAAEGRGQLAFGKDAREAIEGVRRGDVQVAFMPRPVSMADIKEVSDRRERTPPKATYFHPKLPTGLVLKSLEGPL